VGSLFFTKEIKGRKEGVVFNFLHFMGGKGSHRAQFPEEKGRGGQKRGTKFKGVYREGGGGAGAVILTRKRVRAAGKPDDERGGRKKRRSVLTFLWVEDGERGGKRRCSYLAFIREKSTSPERKEGERGKSINIVTYSENSGGERKGEEGKCCPLNSRGGGGGGFFSNPSRIGGVEKKINTPSTSWDQKKGGGRDR